MTVSSSTSDTRYAGNGSTTIFASGFTFYDASSVRVSTIVDATGVETVKTLTTDYTVSGGSGATGSITFLTAPATGTTVVLQRQEPYSQLTDLGTNDPLPAAVLELTYDKLGMQIQQIYRRTLSAVQAPASFDPNTDTPFQMPEPEDGKVLIGNTAETGWENAELASLVSTIDTAFVSLADSDLLEYDSSGALWRNQTLTTVLGRLTTTRGDILTRDATTVKRLGVGTAGQFLSSNGTDPIWANATVPTFQVLTSGTAYVPTSSLVKWIRVRMAGGGGGGGGVGGTTGPTGGTGGTTSFNSVTAIGGTGGGGSASTGSGAFNRGGAGGTGGVGAASFLRFAGAKGNDVLSNQGASITAGGAGGGSAFFNGAGASAGQLGNSASAAGNPAVANSGGGGGGAVGISTQGAAGGGGGECVEFTLIAANYTYAIGAAGAGGIGTGANPATGGAGGAGIIVVEEHYI